MRTVRIVSFLLVVLASKTTIVAATSSPTKIEWIRQLGTETDDYAWSVALDGLGNSYITGQTQGNLGDLNFGLRDAFLAKYDSKGDLAWVHPRERGRSPPTIQCTK